MPHRGDAQGGFQRSVLKPLLRGEPRPLPRRGGNHPRPGFPLGGNGKGESNSLLPQAILSITDLHTSQARELSRRSKIRFPEISKLHPRAALLSAL